MTIIVSPTTSAQVIIRIFSPPIVREIAAPHRCRRLGLVARRERGNVDHVAAERNVRR